MTVLLLSTVVLGIFAGRYLVPALLVPQLAVYAMWLLLAVLLGIGIELGASTSLLERLKRMRPSSLLLPVTSALGSLLGVTLGAMLLGVTIPVGLSIGAGFGWYSLSSVLLSEVAGAEIAAVAFLTNVVRELIAIPIIPLLSRLKFGLAAITPGGATTMDTTLAIISRVTNEETTLVAFYHGIVLSLLVPVLVTFFARMI
ncbi:MAG: hypothetical protein FD169_121 [Bacillota bacterium]|nr:MAG: hypothetical protein FD169_121 [Bacillota bacterium]MBS3950377.1 lysine exporter LysO family protein [Peptococcaceae bacterium]